MKNLVNKKKKKTKLFKKLKPKKILKKLKKKIIVVVLLIIAAIAVYFGIKLSSEPTVDNTYLSSVLSKSSELTTSKLNYTGMTEYHDSGVKIINRSDFIMVYKATVRAGINVKDVKSEVDQEKKVITLYIPKAEIQEVKVDPKTIKYFDEDFALFNVDEKEDSNKAIALAEDAAEKEAAYMGILKLADEQSEALIKGILSTDMTKDYTFKVIHTNK